MQQLANSLLKEIGEQLDQNKFPRIYNGGFVLPEDQDVTSLNSGKETKDGTEGTGGSAAGSWQGTAGPWGAAHRSRPSGKAEPSSSTVLTGPYDREVAEIAAAYLRVQTWGDAEGMWLRSESALLPGLNRWATFFTHIPYSPTAEVRSWGFWTTAISSQWIGPRHTNSDGSICAFDKRDDTWTRDDPLIELIDAYTLWALRHLHQEVLGHWPGYHTATDPVERLTETLQNEFCGCDRIKHRYAICCKADDLKLVGEMHREKAIHTWRRLASRRPPQAVMDLARGKISVATANDAVSVGTFSRRLGLRSGVSRHALRE